MIRKPKKDNIKIVRLILCFFFVVSVLLTFLMSKNIINSIYGNIKSINWVQVDAKLLNASIKITTGSTNSSNRTQYTYYQPKISYEYHLNDVKCIGSKVAWVEGGDIGPLKELAYKFKYHFKHKKPIKIFANPDKHCDAVVDRSIHWSKLTTMIIMFFIAVFFASGIFYLLIKISKK